MSASAEGRASASPAHGAQLHQRSSLGRMPDFFIVGHPKCGTTALHEMLRGHPQIYMPELKETQFFARDMRVGVPANMNDLPDTLEEYLELFAPAGRQRLAGEATPSYLRSPTAAAAIAQLQPSARIIAILREPASFLRSLHMQFLQGAIETEPDLRTALALEPSRREGRNVPKYSQWPRALFYSEHICYVEQLRRYHAAFSSEQVLVLIYDDFRADNAATVARVLGFLEVDDTVALAPSEANPTVVPRSQWLQEAVQTVSVGRGPVSRGLKEGLKRVTPARTRRRALELTRRRLVYRSASAPDEELAHELRRQFKDEVAALSEYLGRDLVSLWGYDGIE
jgi:Sulfotransferase family